MPYQNPHRVTFSIELRNDFRFRVRSQLTGSIAPLRPNQPGSAVMWSVSGRHKWSWCTYAAWHVVSIFDEADQWQWYHDIMPYKANKFHRPILTSSVYHVTTDKCSSITGTSLSSVLKTYRLQCLNGMERTATCLPMICIRDFWDGDCPVYKTASLRSV